MPVSPFHERQVRYLREALQRVFPDRYVTGDVCMYWERDSTSLYRAPDVLVMRLRPEPVRDEVYFAWEDGPADLVIEVGGKSTFREEEGPKIERYLFDLEVREYLYYRPHTNPRRRRVSMWRLVEGDPRDEIATVEPRDGTFRSDTSGVGFAVDADGFLRVLDAEGRAVPDAFQLARDLEMERARGAALDAELRELRAQLERARGSEPRA